MGVFFSNRPNALTRVRGRYSRAKEFLARGGVPRHRVCLFTKIAGICRNFCEEEKQCEKRSFEINEQQTQVLTTSPLCHFAGAKLISKLLWLYIKNYDTNIVVFIANNDTLIYNINYIKQLFSFKMLFVVFCV